MEKEIEKHEQAIKLLLSIQHFERKAELQKENAEVYSSFPECRSKLLNKADTCERAAKRLKGNYDKLTCK